MFARAAYARNAVARQKDRLVVEVSVVAQFEALVDDLADEVESLFDARFQKIHGQRIDFVFIDMEHTHVTVDKDLLSLIIAANESGLGTCVRVKTNDQMLIRTVAEFGADAVVVPHCRTAEEAKSMIAAVKFPPYGIRGSATDCRSAGYGCYPDFSFPEYVDKSNRETLIIPLAEDPEFFDNIDEILDVEGLGGIQLGPSDLALGLGIKETYNFDNPEVKKRFTELFRKAKEKNIPLMGPIAPPTYERACEMVENGVRVMTLRNDVTNFRLMLQNMRKTVYCPLKEKYEGKL